MITGFEAVSRAADRAARERGPDPVDPDAAVDPCPLLIHEMDAFEDDPITVAYGLRSEMSGLVTRQHVERHGCQGWGRP